MRKFAIRFVEIFTALLSLKLVLVLFALVMALATAVFGTVGPLVALAVFVALIGTTEVIKFLFEIVPSYAAAGFTVVLDKIEQAIESIVDSIKLRRTAAAA